MNQTLKEKDEIMIKELCYDTELLSTPCETATAEDAETIQDLIDTLEALDDAACLAANQIGVCKRIVAIKDDNDDAYVFLNPVMSRPLYPSKVTEECLSLKKATKTNRFGQITVDFDLLQDGKLVHRKQQIVGYFAQLMQHCIDHCNGRLI